MKVLIKPSERWDASYMLTMPKGVTPKQLETIMRCEYCKAVEQLTNKSENQVNVPRIHYKHAALSAHFVVKDGYTAQRLV